MKYLKEISILLYDIPQQINFDFKELDSSQILNNLKNLKKQAEIALKKNLVNFSNKLLSTKFNIQNFGSYSILIDFLKRVKITFDYQLESEDFNKKEPLFNLELMIKPIIDLAQNKVSEYNKATQPLIFAVNLYNLVIDMFNNYESFKERHDKLMIQVNDFSRIIMENLFNEFNKKMGIDIIKDGISNKKHENDEKKNAKLILEFMLNLFKDENYSYFLFFIRYKY